MVLATDVLVFAWVGWAVFMLPTLAVLALTSWSLGKVSNRIYSRLNAIYRGECIRYYFNKMEKEGTHAFRHKPDDKAGDL